MPSVVVLENNQLVALPDLSDRTADFLEPQPIVGVLDREMADPGLTTRLISLQKLSDLLIPWPLPLAWARDMPVGFEDDADF